MNQFTAIGNLGSDPTFLSTASGKDLCKFSIAVDRRFQSETDWIPVVVWGAQARTCKTYLQKGSKVAVTGTLRSSSWTDSDGQKRSRLEVHADAVDFIAKIKANETSSEASAETETFVESTF